MLGLPEGRGDARQRVEDRGRGDPGADVDGACQRAGQHDLSCGDPSPWRASARTSQATDVAGWPRTAAPLPSTTSSPADSVIRRAGIDPVGERGSR